MAPIVGVEVVSAVRATSILNARRAMYAFREGPGIYGRSKHDGVSYFLSRSRQYALARLISAAEVVGGDVWSEAHRLGMNGVFEALELA